MKLMLVCTSGGHFATMRSLKSFWSCHDRVWVTDYQKDTSSFLENVEQVHWLPYQAPRNLLSLVSNIPETLKILEKEKPDIIVSTGASLAINFALAARLTNRHFIYIESISRAEKLSISGRVVYPLANEFYVQWPDLCEKYPKAVFEGYVT